MLLQVGLWLVSELGYQWGRRRRREAEDSEHIGTIQGAILGLLALLLGFSFSGASSRYSHRGQLILSEANAISSVWDSAAFFPTAVQPELQELTRRYLAERVSFYEASRLPDLRSTVARSESLLAQMWALAARAALASPNLSSAILSPLEQVKSLHGERVAALRQHLPTLILALLVTCSVVAVFAVSYGSGLARRRNTVLTHSLTFLVAAVLWAIVDLDHPRHGLIRTGQVPLIELQHKLGAQPPAGQVPTTGR